MARKRKNENETPEQAKERQLLEQVANFANRSEKVSWNRKMDNMVKLLAELKPIENQIIELMNEKIPIMDKVHMLREEMIKECVHPYEYLTVHGGNVICKFCDRNISVTSG